MSASFFKFEYQKIIYLRFAAILNRARLSPRSRSLGCDVALCVIQLCRSRRPRHVELSVRSCQRYLSFQYFSMRGKMRNGFARFSRRNAEGFFRAIWRQKLFLHFLLLAMNQKISFLNQCGG